MWRRFRITLARIGHARAPLLPAREVGRGRGFAWAAAGICAAAPLVFCMRGFIVDDALISVRYARHVAEGAGYRFNADGPSTDGVTPLAWPFLLAPLAKGSALDVLNRAKLVCDPRVARRGRRARRGDRTRARAPGDEDRGARNPRRVRCPVAAHAASGMETGVAIALATFASMRQARGPRRSSRGSRRRFEPEMTPWGQSQSPSGSGG